MFSKERIIKLLAEGVLIVISILLAFSIEAWWDIRKEDKEEQKLLFNLQKDFTKNKELLDYAIYRYETSIKNTQALMDYLKPGIKIPNEAIIPDSLLFNLVFWYTYDPVVGTLNSAIASGRISLIENENLRVELALWEDLVRDMKESENVELDILTRINDQMFRHIPIRTMAYRSGNSIMLRESTAKIDYQSIMGSLYFENLIGNRIGEMSNTLSEAKTVGSSLDRILQYLEEELE
jgi:hypothetical protein